jgi:hypothetical protein
MPAKRINGGVVLMIGLPLFAIAASVGTSVIAFTRGDSTLPDEYHWEGMQLDRDFADARHAFDLNVRATLQMLSAAGACRISLQIDGAPPQLLQLSLIHGTRPDLDRQVQLSKNAAVYEGQCGPLPPAHWHLALSDENGTWSVRQEVSGALDGTIITARPDFSLPGNG